MIRNTIYMLLITACVSSSQAQELRLGIVGTDSTHAVEFTRILNDSNHPKHIQGARVVVAYRGGNPDLALSHDRIEKLSSTLSQELAVPFVSAIADLCPRVDGILILSVDPGSRFKEFEQAAACGKPIFIDKPLDGSMDGATRLSRLAAAKHIPWFTASALRYAIAPSPPPQSIIVWGPGEMGKQSDGYTLDLAWYGIHAIEAMYGAMGSGVVQVSRTQRIDTDTILCRWRDGRTATLYLQRPDYAFGALLFFKESNKPERMDLTPDYSALLKEIVTFMQSGKSPVMPEDSLEVFHLMQAAQISLSHHGAWTALNRSTH